MLKNKKLIIIILIILISLLLIAALFLIIPKMLKKSSENNLQDETEQSVESNFSKMFLNLKYEETEEDLVQTVFEYEKIIDGRYDVNVHIPNINLETCTDINDEILEIFGRKLLNILDNYDEYTRYTVDYIYSIHDTIISLIIKASLKEGNNPQRTIIKTYNYDVNDSSQVEFSTIINDKNLNSDEIQKNIMDTIKEKNVDANVLASQGYNIFVRDIKSDEYKIENIENYYITGDEHIYIIFPYGNNNYTETTDIIDIK